MKTCSTSPAQPRRSPASLQGHPGSTHSHTVTHTEPAPRTLWSSGLPVCRVPWSLSIAALRLMEAAFLCSICLIQRTPVTRHLSCPLFSVSFCMFWVELLSLGGPFGSRRLNCPPQVPCALGSSVWRGLTPGPCQHGVPSFLSCQFYGVKWKLLVCVCICLLRSKPHVGHFLLPPCELGLPRAPPP